MKHLFVLYHLAKLALDKGFDEECLAWFSEDKELQIAPDVWKKWTRLPCTNTNIIKVFNKDCIVSPLYDQLVSWFFDKHNILIEPLFDANGMWCVWITNDITKTHRGSGNFLCFDNKHCLTNEFHGWKDKYEALTKALEEAFKRI